MKHFLRLAGGLLLAASLHAAEPQSNDAGPAVNTSSPQQEPAAGRGNPRRPEVAVGTTPAADAQQQATTQPAASAAPATGQPRRGNADRIELSTTQITGNAELPRVMYVVPWKRAELGDLAGKPAKSLLDEVLAPVDRDVFRRQNRYYEALKPDAAPKDP